MQTFSQFQTLVAGEREGRDNFKILVSSVLPRPVAFVSTISAAGVPNLAPFSFFNAVGSSPPAVIFSPCTMRDGRDKDTLINIREVGEFVVHVVPDAIKEGMNETAAAVAPEVNEFDVAGFTPIKSRYVKPPRVAESPVQMECKLVQVVPVGEGPLSANICIGEVLCFHIAEGYLLENGVVDSAKLDLVGRLDGSGYATTRDRFEMPAPKR